MPVIRRLLVLLSLIGATALSLVPAAAHASTAAPHSPVSTLSSGQHVTPAECATLRANLRKPALKCADLMVATKSPASTSSQTNAAQPAAQQHATPMASGTYWTGYLILCQYSGCLHNGWGVTDNIGITFIHKVGVWNNSHSCSATSGVTVTWCGTWHNGYSTYMEEGFNFSPPSGGYARLEIDTYGNLTQGGSTNGAFYYCLQPPGDC